MRPILLALILLTSCSPVGRCKRSAAEVERRIERRVERGMRYNQRCVRRERQLRLPTRDR